MQATCRDYRGDDDFMRVRGFLIRTYALYQRPFNWLVDRWNFCRYHVIPVHTYYNVQYFGLPTGTVPAHRDELPSWEHTIGIWENGAGEIVGLVHSENEEPGEIWCQIHPDYTQLYDEMVAHAEVHLTNWVEDLGYVKLYVNDGSELGAVLMEGFRRMANYGIQCSYMDSSIGFYRKVGFEQLPWGYCPWIRYLHR